MSEYNQARRRQKWAREKEQKTFSEDLLHYQLLDETERDFQDIIDQSLSNLRVMAIDKEKGWATYMCSQCHHTWTGKIKKVGRHRQCQKCQTRFQ